MDEAIKYLNECHEITMKGLNQLPEEDFMNKVKTFNGYEVSCWRLVLAMTEHEIHHRGQLSAYLQMNCIDPPQIFGLKIEQINGE